MQLPWRESASLILAAGNSLKVLLLQRGSRGSFAKNRVFPGGVVHPDDFSTKWEKILKSPFEDILIPKGAARAPCLVNKPGEIAREIGFRITAIRETFEESGILLAQPRSTVSEMKKELSKWRKSVLLDGGKFIEMCKIYGIFPDIFALKIWSDWLTPIDLEGKRFETVFFVAEGEEATQIELSENEIDGFQWISPAAALMASVSGKIKMAPPQVYEFSRFLPFQNAQDLLQFAEKRQKFGCSLTFPVRIRCADGIVGLLPGDDAYPENPDMLGQHPPLRSDKTVAELRTGIKNLHRVEGDFKDNVKAFQFNITLHPGHCDPLVVSPEFLSGVKSKSIT